MMHQLDLLGPASKLGRWQHMIDHICLAKRNQTKKEINEQNKLAAAATIVGGSICNRNLMGR